MPSPTGGRPLSSCLALPLCSASLRKACQRRTISGSFLWRNGSMAYGSLIHHSLSGAMMACQALSLACHFQLGVGAVAL